MKKFPLKPLALWRQAYPALLLGAILGQGIDWLRGEPFSWPSSLSIMAFAAFYVLSSYLLYPTMAGSTGLSLINNWGLRRPVAWDQVSDVRLGRQYGMYSALRVRCTDGRVFWIGTDSVNLIELHAIAVQHGGSHHPLAMALATPLYAL